MEAVWTRHIVRFSERHHINADTGRNLQIPIIDRHTCYDGLLMDVPRCSYTTVLYPYFRILRGQLITYLSVLDKHSRMRFYLPVHDLPLVVYQILYSQCRRNKLTTGSVMIKLTSGQRQNSHAQRVKFIVHHTRMLSQCQSEIGIHVIIRKLSFLMRALHQQTDRTVTQQPDTDVHQEKMSLH